MAMKSSNDQPLKKESYSQVKSLIESIENDRNAEPFMAPVEWEGKYQISIRVQPWHLFYLRNGPARLSSDSEEPNGLGHSQR